MEILTRFIVQILLIICITGIIYKIIDLIKKK